MRIDLYLSQKGYAESRQKAKGLLDAGLVSVNGKPVTKSSFDISDADTVLITGTGLAYVGRGGLKLEGALAVFGYDPSGKIAADIGASTGGFTDCLLQNGVCKVYAIDSGRDQLHPKLKNDRRVISLENCNARNLTREIIPEPIELAVMDLSFISQTCVYPALTRILADGATIISLVKPQFEAGREVVGKNGLVKDKKAHEAVLTSVIETAARYQLYCSNLAVSPIAGGDGNIEYLAIFTFDKSSACYLLPGRNEIHKTVFGVIK